MVPHGQAGVPFAPVCHYRMGYRLISLYLSLSPSEDRKGKLFWMISKHPIISAFNVFSSVVNDFWVCRDKQRHGPKTSANVKKLMTQDVDASPGFLNTGWFVILEWHERRISARCHPISSHTRIDMFDLSSWCRITTFHGARDLLVFTIPIVFEDRWLIDDWEWYCGGIFRYF